MAETSRSGPYRIGIDTGGTFTDIVAVDTGSGAVSVTKVASTPANPAIGLVRGVEAVLRTGRRRAPAHVTGLAHGTTVATNALLQGQIEVARPDRHRRLPAHSRDRAPVGAGRLWQFVFLGEAGSDRAARIACARPAAGSISAARNCARWTRASVRAAARFFRERNIRAVGVCLMHSYANPAHERRAAEIIAEEYPDCALSLSCDVLPEYREYERAITTLVDAFVKPHMERYLRRVQDELGALKRQAVPGDAVERRRRKPGPGGAQADHHGAVGPGRRARSARRWSPRWPASRNVVTLDAGGTSTDLCLIENGRAACHQQRRGRHVPGAHSDDRHRDHRHRRRLDRLDHARRPSEGRAEERRRRARTDVLPSGGNEPTITDANLVLGRIPPALIGGGIALDVARVARRHRGAGGAAARPDDAPSNSPTASSRSPTGIRPTPSAR